MSDDLADLLDDMAGLHPGIDMIRHGLALITEKPLTRSETQSLLHGLAGAEGLDIVTAIGLTVQDLAAPLKDRVQDRETYLLNAKDAVYAAETFTGRQPVIDLIAALDTAGGRCDAMTDEERKELSKKVKKVNDETKKRPR